MKFIYVLAFLLSFVGALNWGLVGVFDFNLVSYIFGVCCPRLETTIYVIVGISALLAFYERFFCSSEKS